MEKLRLWEYREEFRREEGGIREIREQGVI